jgi:hypothetical protein
MSSSISNNPNLNIMPVIKRIIADAEITGTDAIKNLKNMTEVLSENDIIAAGERQAEKERIEIEKYKAIAKAEIESEKVV